MLLYPCCELLENLPTFLALQYFFSFRKHARFQFLTYFCKLTWLSFPTALHPPAGAELHHLLSNFVRGLPHGLPLLQNPHVLQQLLD